MAGVKQAKLMAASGRNERTKWSEPRALAHPGSQDLGGHLLTAISRRGYWHLARTLATQTGMSNAWLEQQGLISIRAH